MMLERGGEEGEWEVIEHSRFAEAVEGGGGMLRVEGRRTLRIQQRAVERHPR